VGLRTLPATHQLRTVEEGGPGLYRSALHGGLASSPGHGLAATAPQCSAKTVGYCWRTYKADVSARDFQGSLCSKKRYTGEEKASYDTMHEDGPSPHREGWHGRSCETSEPHHTNPLRTSKFCRHAYRAAVWDSRQRRGLSLSRFRHVFSQIGKTGRCRPECPSSRRSKSQFYQKIARIRTTSGILYRFSGIVSPLAFSYPWLEVCCIGVAVKPGCWP
jgi:hypothetical protein